MATQNASIYQLKDTIENDSVHKNINYLGNIVNVHKTLGTNKKYLKA